MEITPATFEAVDRYNGAMDSISRKLSVVGSHGILPNTDMNFHIAVTKDFITVQINSFQAVSRSGSLFQISGDSISLKQPYACGRECYIVVHYDGEVEQEINDVPYAKPRFDYVFCQLEDVGDENVPIAKLFQNHDTWNVKELYIPPCTVVSAHPELMKLVKDTYSTVSSIIDKFSDRMDKSSLMALRLLAVELGSYDGMESPKSYYIILNKLAVLLSMNVPEVELPDIPAFNNDDVLLSISVLVNYLHSVDSSAEVPVAKPETPRFTPPQDVIIWDAETRK